MSVDLAGAAWVLPLAFVLQAVSAALIVMRLLRGPSGPDRVVAIDALTLVGAAAVALVSLATAQAVLLDAAVVLALVAFFGSAAFTVMFGASPSAGSGAGLEEEVANGRAQWRRVAVGPRMPSHRRGHYAARGAASEDGR